MPTTYKPKYKHVKKDKGITMVRKQCTWKVRNVAGLMLFVCIVISCAQASHHEEVETEHSFDNQHMFIKKKKEKYI